MTETTDVAEGLIEFLQATAPHWATKLTMERMALVRQVRAAYREGWEDGVKLYAVWKDGEQFVGVMQRPLKDVLERGPKR